MLLSFINLLQFLREIRWHSRLAFLRWTRKTIELMWRVLVWWVLRLACQICLQLLLVQLVYCSRLSLLRWRWHSLTVVHWIKQVVQLLSLLIKITLDVSSSFGLGGGSFPFLLFLLIPFLRRRGWVSPGRLAARWFLFMLFRLFFRCPWAASVTLLMMSWLFRRLLAR